MQLLPLFQRIWSQRRLHQEMTRFDGCLLVSSKVRASNTPKLQSPWLILKGSWFPRCKWPNDGSYLYNLDREVKGHGKFEYRQGSFGRLRNTSQRDAKRRVFVRDILHYLEVQFWFWGRNACLPFAWLCKNAAGIQGNSCPHNTQLSQMTPLCLRSAWGQNFNHMGFSVFFNALPLLFHKCPQGHNR